MNRKIYNNLSIENLIKTEWFNQFNLYQKDEIMQGIEADLDVLLYAKSEFDWLQMRRIRFGLEENLDVSIYAKECFDESQMLFLKYALGDNCCLDKEKSLICAKPEFDENQMGQISLGLQANIDATIYANPRFDWKQMKAFREKLENDKKYMFYKTEKKCERKETN